MIPVGSVAEIINNERALARAVRRAERASFRRYDYENAGETLWEYCKRQADRIGNPVSKRKQLEVPLLIENYIPTCGKAFLQLIDRKNIGEFQYEPLAQDVRTGRLYRLALEAEWPRRFGSRRPEDLVEVWVKKVDQVAVTHGQCAAVADLIEIGAVNSRGTAEPNSVTLSDRAWKLFEADVEERILHLVADLPLPRSEESVDPLHEQLIIDRLCDAEIILPAYNEHAWPKSWAEDVLVETRCRDGKPVTTVVRDILQEDGAADLEGANGVGVQEVIDSRVAEIRKRRVKRRGRDRHPLSPDSRLPAALLNLEQTLSEIVKELLRGSRTRAAADYLEEFRTQLLNSNRDGRTSASGTEQASISLRTGTNLSGHERTVLQTTRRDHIVTHLKCAQGPADSFLDLPLDFAQAKRLLLEC